ncbi:hypothetical protein [Bradyrhizobium guangdongense]|nr:hypothetical protein [Bradyrhizobium guangdongense]
MPASPDRRITEFKSVLDAVEPFMPHQRGMNSGDLLKDAGDLLTSSA